MQDSVTSQSSQDQFSLGLVSSPLYEIQAPSNFSVQGSDSNRPVISLIQMLIE